MPIDLTKTPAMVFSRNLVGIKWIQLIQSDLSSRETAKLDLKVQLLNQSYVVLLVAFWQVFIEELAEYAFGKIEALEGASAFRDIAKSKLDDSLKRFNTPSKQNIDRLFEESLGVSNISSYWHSESLSRDTAVATVADLLATRHEIAHTGRTSKELSYETNFAKMEKLMTIAELTERALLEQLTLRCTRQPTAEPHGPVPDALKPE